MKYLACFILLCCATIAWAQPRPATAKEYNRVFKTYGFSDPDPIVRFGSIYPYYRFDGYTDVGVNKEWKVVELENDYIRVMILPEVGGKIWGAWEKSTGKPFLYFNQVVKFRDVAMRGPWTSGGIEANYGIIGHTPNCATPVDYLVRNNDDGSASCFIGTLDLLTQTYWTIEINLPKDKGYFTTRSFWYNGSALEQPYYTWMNTGLKAAGDLEFVYPGNRYLGHGGEFADWKINPANGKNISFYEQNNFGTYKSYHVFGQYTDFFGAFWHKDNFGMGRFAHHNEKPGKKIWIWGLSQQGMIWEKLLTDTDGQYVEVQSGRLFNQSAEQSTFTPFKHRGFAPGVTDEWTEYWFPVKGTRGFVYANPYGALNLRASGGQLKIDVSPLQATTDRLVVREGTRVVYDKQVMLQPLQSFADSVRWSGDLTQLSATLGETKLQYQTPASTNLERPVTSPSDFDWNSVYGLYLQGKENLRQRFYPQAEEKLKAALARDPNFLPALTDLAMLHYRNLNDEAALALLRRALSVDTYDAAANYYWGLVNERMGKIIDAKDGFDIAVASAEYRSAAYLSLSRLHLREGNTTRAVHYADEALKSNAGNTEALQMKVVAYRLQQQQSLAAAALRQLEELQPLNPFIRFEAWRAQPTVENKTRFTSMIRNEMPHETYLQLADWYISIGQLTDAAEVLRTAPPHAEVYYWLAYVKDKLKSGDGADDLAKANDRSPDWVFPFRARSAVILQWAVSRTDRWEPRYYLGLIYGSRNNREKAREWLQQCGEPAYSPYYAALAAVSDGGRTESLLLRAESLHPNQWRYGKMLLDYYVQAKKYPEALKITQRYRQRFPKDFRIAMMHAKALLMNGQYKACTGLMAATTILPYEGATEGRQLYREAWLQQAVQALKGKRYSAAQAAVAEARRWPENLGVGRPYDADIDDRLEHYLEGLAAAGLRKQSEAASHWQAAAQQRSDSPVVLLSALALRALGKESEGRQLLLDWAQQHPEQQDAQWSLAMFDSEGSALSPTENDYHRVLGSLLNR